MRPPSHQPRPHLPTALRSLNRRALLGSGTRRPSSPAPPPGGVRSLPLRRQAPRPSFLRTPASTTPVPAIQLPPHPPACARDPITPAIPQAQTHRRHPRSVIPAPGPSFLRPVRHSCARSVIPAPAQAGIHATTIASTTPAPSDGPPIPQSPRFLLVAVGPADPHPLLPPPRGELPQPAPAQAGG